MNNQVPDNKPSNDAASWIEPGRQNVQLVYILYLIGLAIGLTVIVGLVFAYMNRGKTDPWRDSHYDPWLDSHYTYQIRTFWIGLLYSLLFSALFVLAFVGIGFLPMFVALIWFVVRCVKGLQMITREQPIDNPKTWLF